MFSIKSKIENGFDIIQLTDESNGTYAEIIPSCGAILDSFVVIKNAEEINVIESYDDYDDFTNNVTSKGFLGSKLSPFVCRINNGKYNFAGKDYTVEKFYLGKNAIHGLLYDQSFNVKAQQANDNSAAITMACEYNGTDPGFPFNYECIVTYELEAHNRLNIFTEIINKDKVSIPMQDGWHPYFKLGAKIDYLKLQFRSFEKVEFNADLIPTGKLIPYKEFDKLKELGNTSFDNCFTLNFSEGQPICLLQNSEKNMEIEIHTDESYPYLQLYTPPHRDSIAIENLSGPPDAFNNKMGYKTLEPGEAATFNTTYKISLLP